MPDPRPITPEEHRAQIQAYEQEIDAYRTWARVLRRALEQGCKATLPGSVVQSREKSVSSFAEKAARRFKDHPDPVRQFTDLCGARVIVQTTEQVAAVRRFIEANFRVLERDDKVLRLSEREFGYRDLHFVVERLPSRDEALGIAPEERERIGLRRAEIQVRTWLQHAWAVFQTMGMTEARLMTPQEIKKVCPIADVSGIYGGLYDPNEGHLDAYGVTHAYALAARKRFERRLRRLAAAQHSAAFGARQRDGIAYLVEVRARHQRAAPQGNGRVGHQGGGGRRRRRRSARRGGAVSDPAPCSR